MSSTRKANSQGNKPKYQENPKDWDYPFPIARDTAKIAVQQKNHCRNLGLWLDRFVSWTDRKDEIQPTDEIKRRKCPPLVERHEKGHEFVELRESWQVIKYFDRWQKMLEAYPKMGYVVENVQAQPSWRVIVGLGAESVLETSIRLHRIYGFPIIPGSAIKGLVRAYAKLVLGKSDDDPELVSICGSPPGKTPQDAGQVIFFDAVPANSPRLKLDVMNPHYSDYYSGGQKPPVDYLSPKPIYFLTVENGSIFYFAVAAPLTHAELAKIAEGWLEDALDKLGIGAKTTAGYGQMN